MIIAWAKKILRVNLTEGRVNAEPLNMDWAMKYIGQRGLASKYLIEEIDPKCDHRAGQNPGQPVEEIKGDKRQVGQLIGQIHDPN